VRRRGFVLVAVLLALVLLTALASGGFFEALQEARIGRNVAQDVVLRGAAESGIAATLASWDPRIDDALSVGASVRLPGASPPGITARVEVRRLDGRLLLVRSSATDAEGTSRAVELIARLVGPAPGAAALRARAADAVASARADGTDRAPPGWTCPASGAAVSALVLQPGASDSAFYRLGPMDWAGLTTWAQSMPPGGDSLGVVYQPGDTTLSGGRLTGTLVVGGDLVLRDGAQVAGLAVVRGTVKFDVGGGSVYGTVVASQVIVNQSVTPLDVVLGYSSCSTWRAALSRAVPRPISGAPIWGVY
jgi:hypothetical protein